MVREATFVACNWITKNCDVVPIQRFFLQSRTSPRTRSTRWVNSMRTRGQRVTAEVVVNRTALREIMGADTESLHLHS